MKNSLYILLIVCIATSCTKELPFPDTDNKNLIVINGLISPEEGVNIHLSETCHITDIECNQKNLENGKVFLKDESGNTLVELIHTEGGVYLAEGFQIEYEKEYTVEASSTGLETITAKTTTPKQINCSLIDFDEAFYQNYLSRTFEIEIEDNPDESNYYLINGWVDILNGEHDTGTELQLNSYIVPHTGFLTLDINAENMALVSTVDVVPYPLDFIFLPDENFNGETYQLEFALYEEDLIIRDDLDLEAHIYVRSVSKELYEYYKSVTLFRLTDGNPLSEPHQIFSNIEKGVGIFGGYSKQEFVQLLPRSEFSLPNDFSIENNGCTAPCTIQFSADMGEKVSPVWNFGDGTTSNEHNPEHEYQTPGEYNVTLTAETGFSGFVTTKNVIIN